MTDYNLQLIKNATRSLNSLGKLAYAFGIRRRHMTSTPNIYQWKDDLAFEEFARECADAFFEDPKTLASDTIVIRAGYDGSICVHECKLIIRVQVAEASVNDSEFDEVTLFINPGPKAQIVIASLIESAGSPEDHTHPTTCYYQPFCPTTIT